MKKEFAREFISTITAETSAAAELKTETQETKTLMSNYGEDIR